MGNWQLEVARMMMYMAFPVAIFHYFNQPEIYGRWIYEKKREIYPIVDKAEEDKIRQRIREIRDNREARLYDEMEQSVNK